MMHQKSYTVFTYQNNKVLPCLCLFFILRNREILSSHLSQIGWCIRINHTHPTILWHPRVYSDLIFIFTVVFHPPLSSFLSFYSNHYSALFYFKINFDSIHEGRHRICLSVSGLFHFTSIIEFHPF